MSEDGTKGDRNGGQFVTLHMLHMLFLSLQIVSSPTANADTSFYFQFFIAICNAMSAVVFTRPCIYKNG